MHAGDLAGLHGQKFRLHESIGDDRLNCLGNFLDRQIQTVRHHRDGLRQPHMLDDTLLHLGA